jgi:hypothetical protein
MPRMTTSLPTLMAIKVKHSALKRGNSPHFFLAS